MESRALLGLVDQLDGNLEELEEALGPMLDDSLNATTKKLPILDRAKLNITVVYAIESLLFCTPLLVPQAARSITDMVFHSISQNKRRQCERTSSLQGAHESKAILRKSQRSRGEGLSRETEHNLEQAGSCKNNTALTGTRKR